MVKRVDILHTRDAEQYAEHADSLQDAIDQAWDLPNGHIHEYGDRDYRICMETH